MRNKRGQFIKGIIPHNKGKSAPWAKNLPQQFKKGVKQKPEVIEKIKRTMSGKNLVGKNNPNWKGNGDILGCLRYRRKHAPRPMPEQCEVCGAFGHETKRGLNYDHNHATGEFRGWLCLRCNTSLGLVKENTETLYALIKYINEHNGN